MKRIAVVLVLVGIVALWFAWPRGEEKKSPLVAAEIETSPVTVTVRFSGEAPAGRIAIGVDPWCERAGASPSREVEARDGRLANVLVRVVGAPARAAGGEAVLDQRGCSYSPRVLGLVKGQRLVVKSSDATGHNVHAYAGEETCFNRAQPAPSSFTPPSLCLDEGVLAFKCDIHPWMTAFVHVLPDPWFAVTGSDGIARLEAPRGTWKLEAWHERFGTRAAEIVVGEGNAETSFEYP